MKKTITLAVGTRLKEELEIAINDDNKQIKTLSKQKDKEEEINSIQALKEEKSTLLVQLSVLIAEQNLKTGRGESHPNAYYIKLRSEYSREKKLHDEIDDDQKDIIILKKKISDLEAKLTKFNVNHKVKVEISKELSDTITTNLGEE